MDNQVNNNLWLSTRAAIGYLSLKGKEITSRGLKLISLQYNIRRMRVDGIHWEYSTQGLDTYLRKLKEPPPNKNKWLLIKEMADILKVSLSTTYYTLKSVDVATCVYRGSTYVNKNQFIKEYRRLHGIGNTK